MRVDAPTVAAMNTATRTAGFGADPGDSYPDYLEKDLNAMGYRYQVINQGISGNTTKDGVDRLQLNLDGRLRVMQHGRRIAAWAVVSAHCPSV